MTLCDKGLLSFAHVYVYAYVHVYVHVRQSRSTLDVRTGRG